MASFRSPLSSFDSLLVSLGWHRQGDMPTFLELGGARLPQGAAPVLFYRQGVELLALVDFQPLHRPGEPDQTFDDLFRRFVDLTLCERAALWSIGRLGQVRFVLAAQPEGVRLLDTQTELPVGRCMCEGDEEAVRNCLRAACPPPGRPAPSIDREGLCADLARWFELFSGSIGPALKWSRRETQRLGYQLILGMKVAIESGDAEAAMAAMGFAARRQGNAIRATWDEAPPHGWAPGFLERAEALAPAGAGAFSAVERKALARRLESGGDAARQRLAEMAQQAAARRRADVMLGLLTSANHEHASWRLALTEPLDVSEEIVASDFYVFEPLTLDLAEVGFGRVLEAVEKLARYAMDRNAAVRRAGGTQLDLIERPPDGLDDRAGVLADPFNWLLRHALRLKVGEPYREALGYLLALHVADLRARAPFASLPAAPLSALSAAIEPAPANA